MLSLQKKIRASITIYFDSITDKQIALSSLRPETEFLREDRVKVQIEDKGEKAISLEVVAADLTSFRAVINSYSRWLKIIEDTQETIQKTAA